MKVIFVATYPNLIRLHNNKLKVPILATINLLVSQMQASLTKLKQLDCNIVLAFFARNGVGALNLELGMHVAYMKNIWLFWRKEGYYGYLLFICAKRMRDNHWLS